MSMVYHFDPRLIVFSQTSRFTGKRSYHVGESFMDDFIPFLSLVDDESFIAHDMLHVIIVDDTQFFDEPVLLSEGTQILLIDAFAKISAEFVIRLGVEIRAIEVSIHFLRIHREDRSVRIIVTSLL
jgi:hypothetical protein